MICARTLFVSGPRLSALGSDERELVETLDAIALSGHSGDRLPIAAEWRAYLATGRSGVLVADGAESEPASAMETALMQLRPHLVLDGLACAARGRRRARCSPMASGHRPPGASSNDVGVWQRVAQPDWQNRLCALPLSRITT